MEISFRPRTPADAAASRATLDAVCRERRFLLFLEAPPEAACLAFIEDLAERRCPQWVAVNGDMVVGWADLNRGSALWGQSHVATLGVGVLAAYRGKGLGRLLVERVLEEAREQAIERIELGVFASNATAITLYRKLGFIEEGIRKRARRVDGIYDDIVEMALFL